MSTYDEDESAEGPLSNVAKLERDKADRQALFKAQLEEQRRIEQANYGAERRNISPANGYLRTKTGAARQEQLEGEQNSQKNQRKQTLTFVDKLSLKGPAYFFDGIAIVLNLVLPIVGGLMAIVVASIPGILVMQFNLSRKGALNSFKAKAIFTVVFLVKIIPVLNTLPAFSWGLSALFAANKAESLLKK